MTNHIWILGATGRSGRAIAERLHEMGLDLVLAGRDPARLRSLAAKLGNADTASGSLDSLVSQLRDAAPAVVVNTVGPFARTTRQVIEACPPGSHYVDLANELPAVEYALEQHDKAVEEGSTIVSGAGFGVLGTESLVVKMCALWPEPTTVRVDAIPSVAIEEGAIGSALAGSILDGLPEGGRKVERGRLVRSAVAGQRLHLTTPNGDSVTTAALPTGDLVAAWRASNADSVVSASNMIPSGPAVSVLLPVVSFISHVSVLRRFAVGRLAKVHMRAKDMPREYSWGHCAMEWSDGTRREGWLRLADAQEFTTAVTAEIARRLATGEVRTGAYTPAALFGPELAEAAGGTFFVDRDPT
jgi:short subunit dehydrogenase-like uncharacterized protein